MSRNDANCLLSSVRTLRDDGRAKENPGQRSAGPGLIFVCEVRDGVYPPTAPPSSRAVLPSLSLASRRRSAVVPGTISGVRAFSSMTCRSSAESITSFSISRLARPSSAGRRARQDVADLFDRFVDDPLHFLVDLAGRLLAVARARAACRRRRPGTGERLLSR